MNSSRLSYVKSELLDTFRYVYKVIFAYVIRHIKIIYISLIHKRPRHRVLFTVEHFDVCPKKAASVVPRYHNRLELSEACFPHKENRLSFQAMA